MGMAKLRTHLIRAEAMELGDPHAPQFRRKDTHGLWQDTHAAYTRFLEAAAEP